MMTMGWSLARVSLLQVLPEGFALPPLVYLLPVLVATAGMAVLLYYVRPPITDWTLVALVPWMAIGSTLYVLYQQNAFLPAVKPLFGNPTVYLTTAAATAFVWTASEVIAEMRSERASTNRQLGVVGGTGLVCLVAFSLYVGSAKGTLEPLWPVIGVALSAMGAAFAWIAISFTFTETAKITGRTGAVVVFAHVLDGVSTAIGVDALAGVGERTPFSALILDYASQLPTAQVIGSGWLFLLVKLILAVFVVVAFTEYVDEEPAQARLVLALVAALGLGPGAHNLLLFTVIESVPG